MNNTPSQSSCKEKYSYGARPMGIFGNEGASHLERGKETTGAGLCGGLFLIFAGAPNP